MAHKIALVVSLLAMAACITWIVAGRKTTASQPNEATQVRQEAPPTAALSALPEKTWHDPLTLAQREALAADSDAKFDADIARRIKQGKLRVGMTRAEVRAAWGEPTRVENAHLRNPSERWIYNRGGKRESIIVESDWLVKIE